MQKIMPYEINRMAQKYGDYETRNSDPPVMILKYKNDVLCAIDGHNSLFA